VWGDDRHLARIDLGDVGLLLLPPSLGPTSEETVREGAVSLRASYATFLEELVQR